MMEYCRDWRASNLLWRASCDGCDFTIVSIDVQMRIVEDAIVKWYNHMDHSL